MTYTSEVLKIETFVFEFQKALLRAMRRKGISQKQLASSMGISPARVSQLFSGKGANVTLKTIARLEHALGEEIVIFANTNSSKKWPERLMEVDAPHCISPDEQGEK